jgi:DNA-binding winged helix-turn-helix (wHTH) protein/Tfp pilus assembly protein PilF
MKSSCEFGPFRLDCERRLLRRGADLIPLPAKALDTLVALVHRRGEVVSKDDLMKAVWPDTFVEEANLSQNIHILRKALGEKAQEHRFIVTVPGRGYSFVATVTEVGENHSNPVLPPIQHGLIQSLLSLLRLTARVPNKGWLLAALLATLLLGITFLERRPVIARLYNNLGVQLQRYGNIKAAIGNYQHALRWNPGYAEAHYNLADAYEDVPSFDKALEEYQRAIEADPTFYEAYNNLARLYITRHKDYEGALGLLDRALDLQPREPSVQYSLHKNYGWANFELHYLTTAEQHLRLAVGLDRSRGAAHCLLAKTLDAERKQTSALQEWELCAAYSSQAEVEPEWRARAQERLSWEARQ